MSGSSGSTRWAGTRIGSTMIGVTTTTSSVSLCCQRVLPKSDPMIGMFISSGMPVRTFSRSSSKRPEMMRLWSRRTSIVLSTRRVRSAGIRKPWSRTAFV